MTNTEILTKAIQKAIGRGLDFKLLYFDLTEGGLINSIDDFMTWLWERANNNDKLSLIFNHDFAKALWGEGKTVYRAEVFESPTEGEAGFDEYLDAWEYHLQMMVIAEDPIKYLGEHLDG